MAKGTIKAKIAIEGASEYKEALKNIAVAEKELQSEMKKSQAQYKGMEESTEALAKKKELLARQIALESEKLTQQQRMVQSASKAQQDYATRTEKLKEILRSVAEGTEELSQEQKDAAKAAGAQVESVEELADAISRSENGYAAAGRAMRTYQTAANNTEAGLYNLNRELEETQRQIDGMEEETDGSTEGLQEMGESAEQTGTSIASLGDLIKANIASEVILAGIKALASGIKEIASAAVETGMEFEASMGKVAATMGMTADEINSGSEAYKMLEDAAKECGETTMFSASEAAEALNYLALAGYDAAKSAETLPKVLNLAAAGGMDLATASDMVTDAMAALGMETKDLDKYIDEMAVTAQKSNTSVQQLGEATLVCAGVARTAGMDLEDMNTALGVLANNGIKGAEGGTHLRNVLLSLSSPTDVASKKLEELGVKTQDAGGNMRGLDAIIQDLNMAVADMGTADKAKALNTIFNKTDIAAVNALLKSTNGEYESLRGNIENAAGAAENMANTMNDNLKGKLTILESSLQSLGISAYQIFDDKLKGGVESATKAVGRLNDSVANGKMHVSLNRISEALGEFIEKSANLIEDILPGIIEGASWCIENFDLIVAGIGGIVAANVMMGTVKPIIDGVMASWMAYKTATEGATVSQWLLNAAQSASPAGILLTAVTGLVAALGIYAAINASTADSVDLLTAEQRKMVDEAQNTISATKQEANARKESIANMDAQKRMVANLRAELASYTTANGEVTGSQERVKQIVGELNAIIPELGLAYDETTQKLSMSTEEIENNTDALLRQAEATAVQNQLTQVMQDRIDVETQMARIEDEYNAAQEELIAANERRKAAEDALNEALETGASNARELAAAAQEEQLAYEDTAASSKVVIGAYTELESELAALGDEQDYLTDRISGTTDAMGAEGDAAGELTGDMLEAASEISDSWLEMKESVASSIKGQIDLFSEYTGATKQSKDEILKNMREQVAGVQEWSDNLQQLARRGISEGLLQELAKMGPEGAGYVAAFKEMSGDELQEASKLFEEAMVLPDDTLERVEDAYKRTGQYAYKGYKSSIEDGKEEAQSFTEEQFADIGESVAEGAANGVEQNASKAIDATTDMAEEMVDSAKDTLQVHSPSKVFTEIGQNVAMGIVAGINQRAPQVRQVSEQMARTVTQTVQNGLNVTEFANIGRRIGEGLVSGINEMLPAVQAAAHRIAAAAAVAAKAALGVHSPSKVFEEIGEFTGEGFIIGFEDSVKDFGSMVNNLVPALETSGGSAAIVNGNTITNNFTIYAAEGQNEQTIATAVEDRLLGLYDRKVGTFA